MIYQLLCRPFCRLFSLAVMAVFAGRLVFGSELNYERPRECVGRPFFKVKEDKPFFFSSGETKLIVEFCHGLKIEEIKGALGMHFTYPDGHEETVLGRLYIYEKENLFEIAPALSALLGLNPIWWQRTYSDGTTVFVQDMAGREMLPFGAPRQFQIDKEGNDDLCREGEKCRGYFADWDEDTGALVLKTPTGVKPEEQGVPQTYYLPPFLTRSELITGKKPPQLGQKIMPGDTTFLSIVKNLP